MHRTQNQKHKLNEIFFFGRIVQHTQNTAMQENAVGEWQGGHRRGETLKNQYRLLGDGRAEVQTHEGITFFVDDASLPDIQGMTWHAQKSDIVPGTWYICTNKPRNPSPRFGQHGCRILNGLGFNSYNLILFHPNDNGNIPKYKDKYEIVNKYGITLFIEARPDTIENIYKAYRSGYLSL